MLRFSRLAFCIVVIFVSAAWLPDLYWKVFDKSEVRPFLLYSVVNDKYMYSILDEFREMRYMDEDGKEYSRKQYCEMLPFFHYADLVKWDKVPQVITDLGLGAMDIRREQQIVKIRPSMLHSPQIHVYPLFESESEYSGLEMPESMFRITDRMEFIEAHSNTLDKETSRVFTQALVNAGFVFPATYITGNPTTRKPFDEGYLIADAASKIFHVKMVKGEPFVRHTGLLPEAGLKYLEVVENTRREFLGVMVNGLGEVCLISYDNYRPIPMPVKGYDPDSMTFYYIADPLNRNLMLQWLDEETDAYRYECVLTDREYVVERTYEKTVPREKTALARTIADTIFPFSVKNQPGQ